jgi:hypothetical protein
VTIKKSGSNAQPTNHHRSGFAEENVVPNCDKTVSVAERLGGVPWNNKSHQLESGEIAATARRAAANHRDLGYGCTATNETNGGNLTGPRPPNRAGKKP